MFRDSSIAETVTSTTTTYIVADTIAITTILCHSAKLCYLVCITLRYGMLQIPCLKYIWLLFGPISKLFYKISAVASLVVAMHAGDGQTEIGLYLRGREQKVDTFFETQ